MFFDGSFFFKKDSVNSLISICFSDLNDQQEGHDGPEIAHLSLLTKHAPSSFPVT